MSEFALGLDFGSNSARALIIDIENGVEYGTASCVYPGGEQGVYHDLENSNLARQNPLSYIEAMTQCIKGALAAASAKKDFTADCIVGIGVDATASTPVPVNTELKPLAALPEFADNLNAYAWMWKDHCSIKEAEKITSEARAKHPEYLAKCGGSYSSEWFWSKVWHCLNVDRKVFDAAYTWLDFPDFIPVVLGGITDLAKVIPGVCAAGHKSLYCEEWGGLPADEFLKLLAPELAELKNAFIPKLIHLIKQQLIFALNGVKNLGFQRESR